MSGRVQAVRRIVAWAYVAATLALGLAAVVLQACGGGDGAEEVLAETAAELRGLESGVVSVRVRIAPKADAAERTVVELTGRFALDGPGGLPVGRIVYTEVRGRARDTATVLWTRRGAYTEVGGRAYELAGEQADLLKRVRDALAQRGLAELDIDDWIEAPELSDGGLVDGTETERIDGSLDVAAAIEDLAELERLLGGGAFGRLAGTDLQTIEAATRSTAMRLFTGAHDRLLRRLEVEIDLGFDVPSPLRRTLGRLEGARIDFELRVSDPNRPVSVAEPRSVRPSSELPPR